MSKRSIPLQTISIAAPCSADWNKMIGNDQVKFCQECKLNVYNLSSMTQQQAEDLIRQKEGKLCVRYFRRTDGTILTQNCPVGLQTLKKKVARVATAVISALLSFGAGFGLFSYMSNKKAPTVTGTVALVPTIETGTITPSITPNTIPSIPDERGHVLMGEMAAVPPPVSSGTPIDELSSEPETPSLSSCSIKNNSNDGEVLMGKIALPRNEGSFEMGDVSPTPKTLIVEEKQLRNAAIESPEIELSNEIAKGKTFKVTLRIEIDNIGNVIGATDVSSDAVLPEVLEATLNTVYQWKFDTNKLNGNGAKVVGILSFSIKN